MFNNAKLLGSGALKTRQEDTSAVRYFLPNVLLNIDCEAIDKLRFSLCTKLTNLLCLFQSIPALCVTHTDLQGP